MLTRRKFLGGTLAATAASYSRIYGANGRINVAFIGTGKMGIWGNMEPCKQQLNTHISHVCDVWDHHLAIAMRDNPKAKATKDFLQVLDDYRDIDAVCINTPDHWHALMAVMAMERGLHVYCEKPIAHCVEEVKTMVRAQQKFYRVFQSGQWQHSDPSAFPQANDWVQSEALGQLQQVYCTFYGGADVRRIPDSSPPDGLGQWGWERWIGPAPYRLFNWMVFQSDPDITPQYSDWGHWRFFLDYGCGMLGDWGPHVFTPGVYGLNGTGPYRIVSRARLENIHDMRDAPNVWFASADFKDRSSGRIVPVIFDHNTRPSPPEGARAEDTVFHYASGARIRVNRESFQLIDATGDATKEVKHAGGGTEHWQDFIQHIRNDDTHTRTSLDKIASSHIALLGALALYRAYPPSERGQDGGGEMLWNPEKHEMLHPKKEVLAHLGYHYREPWNRYMPKL